MVFSSIIFLCYFLPITLAGYFFAPKKWKNLLLILVSLFFYAWGEGVYIVFLLISAIITHFSVVKIQGKGKFQKGWFIFSLIMNLGMLGFMKYAIFLIANINYFFSIISVPLIPIPDIHLPIGISFFVFQAVSYIIDVYRGDVYLKPKFTDTLLYISLFPQLIAGPIVRFTDIQNDIHGRVHKLSDIVEGSKRFIRGLGKKVLIANQMALVADGIFALPEHGLSFALAWVGIFAYSIQIFFDFSGYSDMAIGLGKIFGFSFPENFNFPYISKTVQEFWRKWHMSLSSWIKDYLYIPLGGSRKGKYRTYLNLFMVFTLVGLWHGAGWTFVLWGIWYGILLILERMFLARVLGKLWSGFSHAYLLFVTMIGWTFFRADHISDAIIYLRALFGLSPHMYVLPLSIEQFVSKIGLISCIVGTLLCTPIVSKINKKMNKHQELLNITSSVWYVVVLVISLLFIGIGTYNPFIYFRF